MFQSSTKSIQIIQIFTLILSLVGLFFFNFTIENILISFIFYFLYSGIGISLMMHRYYSHKSFQFRFNIIKHIFNIFAILAGRGSMLGWVYIHRLHHMYADTKNDPHLLSSNFIKILFPDYSTFYKKIDLRVIKDLLNTTNIKIDKYYNLIIIFWVLIISYLLGIEFLYFAWIIPVMITHLVLNSFLYYGHTEKEKICEDKSKNSWIYALIIWGEGWHNNHHINPKNWKYSNKWYELDIISFIIRMIKI